MALKALIRVGLVLLACGCAFAAGEGKRGHDDTAGSKLERTATDESKLGTIDFPNSGKPEAQEAFIRAVLLLHCFEYEDAAEAFVDTRKIDPDFALAYWGEAMTHNRPLWRHQDRDKALKVLKKFAKTPEKRLLKTPTERERGYMAALEALYGEGEKKERDFAYSEAMRELSERYPDDLEAKSFYALSILGTAGSVRDTATYMRAGAVTEEIFDAHPRHPGAVHYMIHSYDDPEHAPLGLRAARVYAQIAPAASHAQHMISHIYVALGHWKETVDANIKAVDVSVQRRERKDLKVDSVSYHALHWLEYSYLQLGRFEDARRALEQMSRYAAESGSKTSLWHHAAMRSSWIVETGGLEAPAEIESDDTHLTGAAADLFATGYAALLAGKVEDAEAAARAIDGKRESASHAPTCDKTARYDNVTDGDLKVAEVLQKSLLALIAVKRGETDEAFALLDEATAIEESLPLAFGPPAIVKPTHEIYGEVLLSMGRPADARAQFEKALARAPRRSLSLAGLARAARAEGDASVVKSACSEISDIYAGADESISAPKECTEKAKIAKGT